MVRLDLRVHQGVHNLYPGQEDATATVDAKHGRSREAVSIARNPSLVRSARRYRLLL